ncbi:hypothetical protein L228DRAFT_245692 [Xylona heveae TC161]|uniref:LEA domain protein n=1 Tax=Xylona heveae (strain CBS 132557 / TC161) TaxID=1328760 RepID=A0A165ICJ5_XYLHT|nr:hypothetical protein L228DRAFT_245692 [Xylona heveae TC161]KZF24704.1 hypothetical protein L228DRAFT_245692 [Xylona heveae TC161]
MSFMIRRTIQVVGRRTFTTTPRVANRGPVDSVKNAAHKIDHKISDELVKGIEKGQHAFGLDAKKAAASAQEMAGEVKGKASELSGQAKGKASEVKGKAKGKANEFSSEEHGFEQ